jgi:hypothetical protein
VSSDRSRIISRDKISATKAALSRDVVAILIGWGTGVESWWARLASSPRGLFGRVLAATVDRLQDSVSMLVVHRLVNLARCPAR